jgi:ferritin-like metal-binding protein YciE
VLNLLLETLEEGKEQDRLLTELAKKSINKKSIEASQ